MTANQGSPNNPIPHFSVCNFSVFVHFVSVGAANQKRKKYGINMQSEFNAKAPKGKDASWEGPFEKRRWRSANGWFDEPKSSKSLRLCTLAPLR